MVQAKPSAQHCTEYLVYFVDLVLEGNKINRFHPLQCNLPFSKHRPSGPMLSISRNVHMCVCVCVCVFVCLFTFEVPFNGLFAPNSRSRMSNIFRDSESLGKSNGKKWSHI